MSDSNSAKASRPSPSRADRWARFRIRVLPWFGLSLSILFLLIGIVLYASPQRKTRHELTVTAGSKAGVRARFIELLAARYDSDASSTGPESKFQLTFSEIETSGSVDALRRVDSGEIDLAFVQGGLPVKDFPSVRQVASLHLETLHLLVRSSIHQETKAHLRVLRGKKINLSTKGSGTHELSKTVLHFARLESEDYQESNLSYSELLKLTPDDVEQGAVPDAVFIVSSIPSPVATYLVSELDYRLVPLPLASPIRHAWLALNADDADDESRVARALRRVERIEVPELTYQIDPPRPEFAISTIGIRLNLVAGKNVKEEVVESIIRNVYETDYSRVTDQKLRWEELSELAEFPLHPGTAKYLTGKQPIATRQVIEITEQLVGIVGAMIGAMLFLWQWLRRMRARRKDAEFVNCIDRVVQIENEALSYEDDLVVPVAHLQAMQEELSEIKSNLIERYRDGYLEGAETLSSFLKHANDASEFISRIVLHHKEKGKDETR